MNVQKIIICTTAICRKNIHNICFPPIINKLNELKDIEIHWIINIDNVGNENEDQSETRKNLEIIIPKTYHTYFILPTDSSHPKAVNNIIHVIKKNNFDNDNIIFFWLEDDWKIDHTFDIYFLLQCMTKNTWIALTIGSLGTFQPSFIGNELFHKLFKKLSETVDAEKQIFYKRKKIIKNEELDIIYLMYGSRIKTFYQKLLVQYKSLSMLKNHYEINYDDKIDKQIFYSNKYCLILINEKIFIDVGRNWIKNTKLQKWNNDSKIITYIKN